jgi:hypothetical protein
VVKASTWEAPFSRRIEAVRSLELRQLSLALLQQNLMGFLVNAVPTLVPVASFAAYLLMGGVGGGALAPAHAPARLRACLLACVCAFVWGALLSLRQERTRV